ncbi:hypothetical protein S7711_11203 [Stachybotrys chartarum IBT 7711]|uniref:Uncharacterized protein n=1 Tax=Stachybotrys chartarum (strain CBS 109288 / IBT 7711) TaxID=1280523 RepID=A0A084AKT3_STACB|nr:hypothetical protein S7711_11203 [Stachybotrys chartarum IBT 7711]KFA55863.1 hypothetical protein S40293_10564 [Stachybotrys chartarum IBT 40293]
MDNVIMQSVGLTIRTGLVVGRSHEMDRSSPPLLLFDYRFFIVAPSNPVSLARGSQLGRKGGLIQGHKHHQAPAPSFVFPSTAHVFRGGNPMMSKPGQRPPHPVEVHAPMQVAAVVSQRQAPTVPALEVRDLDGQALVQLHVAWNPCRTTVCTLRLRASPRMAPLPP